jgi:hypothetical protein
MRDYEDDDYDDYDYRPRRHSGLGIASFILAMAAGLIVGVFFVVVAIIETRQPGALGHDGSSDAVVGLIACFALFLAMVGVGLGIAGVCQKRRKTVFAVLGLMFNGLILLSGGCLVLIGLAQQQF